MEQKMVGPGALAGALGAENKEDHTITTAYRLRIEQATSLSYILGETEPEDAVVLCAAYLDYYSAGDPDYAPFGNIRADANFWATCAQPIELEVYFVAILKRLGDTALGIIAQKRLFMVIRKNLSVQDQSAFLNRVRRNSRSYGGFPNGK